jgi:hypothetical protein
VYYAKDIVDELNQSGQIAIFGAGIMALDVAGCLLEKPYRFPIECCLVSDLRCNPSEVLGIPVINFSMAAQRLHKDAVILVAAADGKNLDSMRKTLRQHGYTHLISVHYESDLWCLLRGNSYREACLRQNKPYLALEEELEKTEAYAEEGENSIRVYTAKCHVDRPVQEDLSRYSWETPIQVGAALTEKRICEICDNTGDHISDKNSQYCEVTALYWIWKNDCSDYVGLGHYRRHFELTEEQVKKLAASDIDVVLTIPIFDFPDVETVYRRDHVGSDWDVMLEAIRILAPDYRETAQILGGECFYYGYNMFIMRREIFEEYCRWLFPILFYCEEHCGKKKDAYQNRYIGFLAEHLMAIYFRRQECRYKIVHARKHFVEG